MEGEEGRGRGGEREERGRKVGRKEERERGDEARTQHSKVKVQRPSILIAVCCTKCDRKFLKVHVPLCIATACMCSSI